MDHREREHHDRHGLMQERQRDRRLQQQRHDPDAACRVMAPASASAPLGAKPVGKSRIDIERVHDRSDKKNVGDGAMIELHHQIVLEKISPQRRKKPEPITRRDQGAVDQRPGVVGEPGISPATSAPR